MKIPQVLGHRMSRHEGIYENTHNALTHALHCADGVETDCVLSRDGEVFLIHDTMFTGDATIYELNTRLSDASRAFVNNRRIDEMTASEIEQITLIDGQHIPRLDEFLAALSNHPDFVVDMEIKSPHTAVLVAEKIKEVARNGHVRTEQFFFSSFNHPELLRLRRTHPEFPIGILYEASNTFHASMYPWLPDESGIYTPYSATVLDDAIFTDIAPDYICLNDYDLRADVLAAIHARHPNIKIYSWWYYAEAEPAENLKLSLTLRQLEKAGTLHLLKGIITDYPERMKRALATLS